MQCSQKPFILFSLTSSQDHRHMDLR
uniref:Uncharacterized protein n=1 Tax=Rhizophora mucronata TaxID=61149 RepID=A0A2P2N2Z4_RHIMU